MAASARVAMSFVALQRQQQGAYFTSEFPGKNGYGNSTYRLDPAVKFLNLAPSIQESAQKYFEQRQISWHLHANHALSSQACCLNFLMPLAEKPGLLARVIGEALGISGIEMLEVEMGPNGNPWFVGFEWNGLADHLNESGVNGRRTRGANSTSADAIVRFRHEGRIETILIEWKYTESYGQPISPSGNETRQRRYEKLVFAPDGPLQRNLGLALEDFFYEPFYQLLRQQMLAFQLEKSKEMGAERVRVLHISPAANLALKRVTSPALARFGSDAFEVFRSFLLRPDNFIICATETTFSSAIKEASDDNAWAAYLVKRYRFIDT